MTENGTVPDATTLKYLGNALAPMAGQYAASTSSDVPTTQTERVYTPAETSTLLNQFADTNPARYADTSINSINFQGVYTGDLTYDYARFYDRNIAVSYDLGNTVSGGLSGTWQGTKAAISNTVSSAWSLLSSPVQSSEQLANGVMSLTKNPLASAWNSLESSQSKEGLATAYQMQGNNEAAAAIRNQGNVEFGLNLVPVERVASLGSLGNVVKTADELYIERLLTEKGPASGLPSGETKVVGDGRPAANDISFTGEKATDDVVPTASVVTAGATRTGVVRTNAADWRALRDNWDDLGYGQILSTENRTAIAKGRTPKVDEVWVKVFPEDAGLIGERISMHHVQGSPLTVPLPATRHLDAHMPGGFRYNPGGPGSALPAYPSKKGVE